MLLKAIEKLRKFSQQNWLTIVLVVIGLLFIAVFVFKQEKWVRVEVKIQPKEWWWDTKNPPYWLGNNVKISDQQFDALGISEAKVEDIRSYEVSGGRKSVYLTMSLKSEVDRRNGRFSFNHVPLTIGSSIELSFDSVGFQGVVTQIDGQPDIRRWVDKVVEARVIERENIFPETLGIQPWKAEAINVGDIMKDSRGRIIAEILKKEVKPADKIVTSSDGRILVVQDPLKKDVSLIVKLKTFLQGDVDYFLDETKVKVGVQIPLYLPKIDISPEITKVID